MNKTLTAKKRLRYILTPLILAGLCLIGTDLLVYLLATLTDLSMEALDSNFLYLVAIQDLPILLVCGIYLGRTHMKPEGRKGELSGYMVVFLLVMMALIWYFAGTAGSYLAEFMGDAGTVEYNDLADNMNVTQTILSVLVLAPVAEELLLRGVFYPLWSRAFGICASMILTALAFALIHGTVMHLLFTFFVGIILAYVYQVTKKLTSCILFHQGFNFMSIVASVIFNLLNIDEFAIPFDFFALACLVIFVVLVKVLVFDKRFDSKPQEDL